MIKYDYVWVGKIGNTWFAKTTRKSNQLKNPGDFITVYSQNGNQRTARIVSVAERKVNPITRLVTQIVVVE